MKITLLPKTRQALLRNLKLAQELGDLRWNQRLQSIIMIADWHEPLPRIAELFQVTLRTIYDWIALFMLKRVDGLRYLRAPGRPSRLNQCQKKVLKKMIVDGPEAHGYTSGGWTASLIKDLVEHTFGVTYSPDYMSQLLREMGLSHQKVQNISHKANKEEQRKWEDETFPCLLKQAEMEGAVIAFQDESTFQMWSKPGHSWGIKGQQIETKVHMSSIRQKVYGAIELGTGKLTWMFSEKSNHTEFMNFLKLLVHNYPGKKIYVIIDNGPIHQGENLVPYLQRNRHRVELKRLPPYSPKFNPIEKLWKQIKKNFFHSRCFQNKTEFLSELKRALRFYQDNPALVLSLMTKWKWLQQRVKQDIQSTYYKAVAAERLKA